MRAIKIGCLGTIGGIVFSIFVIWISDWLIEIRVEWIPIVALLLGFPYLIWHRSGGGSDGGGSCGGGCGGCGGGD